MKIPKPARKVIKTRESKARKEMKLSTAHSRKEKKEYPRQLKSHIKKELREGKSMKGFRNKMYG